MTTVIMWVAGFITGYFIGGGVAYFKAAKEVKKLRIETESTIGVIDKATKKLQFMEGVKRCLKDAMTKRNSLN